MFDFFVVPLPEGPEAGFYFDCVKEQSADLAKRVNFHKMRAKVTIEDLSGSLGVAAFWGAEPPAIADATVSRDCRVDGMGWRVIAPIATLEKAVPTDMAAYQALCIANAVPKGGVDFEYGDTFVHDVNLDQLHGVDFKKGCYVGQEVVARVHFRKSARKRIVKIHFDGPAPAPGTPVMAGETNIGLVGSIAGSEGLAQLRLDFWKTQRRKARPSRPVTCRSPSLCRRFSSKPLPASKSGYKAGLNRRPAFDTACCCVFQLRASRPAASISATQSPIVRRASMSRLRKRTSKRSSAASTSMTIFAESQPRNVACCGGHCQDEVFVVEIFAGRSPSARREVQAASYAGLPGDTKRLATRS